MDDLRDKYISLISDAADEAALEDLRVQAVGKKGEVSLKMRELGKMTPEERQVAGPALNAQVLQRGLIARLGDQAQIFRFEIVHDHRLFKPGALLSQCRVNSRRQAAQSCPRIRDDRPS